MKAYFLAVILTAIFGGICEEVLPESSSVRPHMKLVTGLCVLAVIVLPAKDALISVGDFFGRIDLDEILENEQKEEEYEEILDGALSRYSAEEIGRCLGELLEAEYGLADGTCHASVVLGADGTVSRALVTLSGTSILTDPYKIEAFVNALLACPCDVAVE